MQCTVEADKPALVKWVLKEGQPLWVPALLEPSISAAIAAAGASSLQYLLASCSVAWPPQQLGFHLASALEHPDKDAKALVRVVLMAAAALGQQWTAADLNQALLQAVWAGKVGALHSLLQHSGVEWTCQELLPAIMEVAEDMDDTPSQVGMIEALLRAAADEWTAGKLEVVLTATAGRTTGGVLERNVLAAVLKHRGIKWSVEQLLPALEVIAGSCNESGSYGGRPMGAMAQKQLPLHSRHWFKEMVADLLAAAKGQWTQQQLTRSVKLATGELNAGVVEVSLRFFPNGWRGEHLLAAVELAAQRSCTFHRNNFERILSTLLEAAKGRWTAEMLAAVLGDAAVNCTTTAVKELLEVEGVQWTVVSLQCAMVKAARHDKLEALKLMLSVPSVEWQVGQVQAMLAAAGNGSSWSCFYRLLQLPAAASLSSADLQELVDVIVEPPVSGLRFSDYPLSSSDLASSRGVKSRCPVLLKLLAHPNHGGIKELTGALTVAAAGDKELLAQLLEQRGLQWTKEQLQPAVRAAVRACQWEVMEQLLAVLEGGWSSRELLPLLQGALKSANSVGVQNLLSIPASTLVGGWSLDDKLSVVTQTVRQTRDVWVCNEAGVWQCLGQVLAVSLDAGWGAGELHEIVTAAAKSDVRPLAIVQQLLAAFPIAAWRGIHMLEAALAAALPRRGRWDRLELLLRVHSAQWTGEQLGRVMQILVSNALELHKLSWNGWVQVFQDMRKLVSDILAVTGIEWKGAHSATTAAEAAGNREAWGVLELLLVIEDAEWTREQLLPVMKAVLKAAGWAEQLPLVLCAGEDVQWEAQDLVDALKKAVAAEKWVLAEQLVAAGSTAVWDVLQLAEVLQVGSRQGQVLLVEQLLAVSSVG